MRAMQFLMLVLWYFSFSDVSGGPATPRPKTMSDTNSATVSQQWTASLSDSFIGASSSDSASSSRSSSSEATLSFTHSRPSPSRSPPSATITISASISVSFSESLSNIGSSTATSSKERTLSKTQYTSPIISKSTMTASFSAPRSESRSTTQSESMSPSVSVKSVSQPASETATDTRTVTPPPTPSRTPSPSYTQQQSQSRTFSMSMTYSTTVSQSQSASETYSMSISFSGSESEIIKSRTATHSYTPTNSSTPSDTVSEMLSVTDTMSTSESYSTTASTSKSRTPTIESSRSVSTSMTASTSMSLSTTVSSSVSYSDSVSRSFTDDPSLTLTLKPTRSHTTSKSSSTSHSETIEDSVSRTFSESTTLSYTTTWTFSGVATPSGMPTRSTSISPSSSRSGSTSDTAEVSRSFTISYSKSTSFSGSVSSSASLSQSYSTSTSTTTSNTNEGSKTRTISFSGTFSLSVSVTVTQTLLLTDSDTQTLSDSMTITLTDSHSHSDTFSVGLTTSPMPPTTTHVPTPSFTLPTRCPSDCMKGVCQQAILFMPHVVFYCTCYASTANGYWAGSERGGPCDRCARGYYGLQCLSVCPGGACSICSGHGTCNDGLYGDGTCSCRNNTQFGFWTGNSCNRCMSGYYGSSCLGVCNCGAHGTCSEGTTGDGTCKCSPGWLPPTCNKCDVTVNAFCESLRMCPGADNNCNGHGACNFTLSDNGVCDCYPYYATVDCSVMCPNQCSGHGVCSQGRSGTGVCTCNSNYLAPTCATCVYGRYNSNGNCAGICPGVLSPGGLLAVCNNNGTCNDDGTCTCYGIRGGKSCNLTCPVASWNASLICGGHGTCNDQAKCVCNSDSIRGYWTGATCETCDDYHGGPQCLFVCPVGPSGGLPCGNSTGDGYCVKATGVCDCSPTKCGRYCNVDRVNGICAKCANSTSTIQYYGFDCKGVCACVNGNCSDGVAGDGSCSCERGWAGAFCNISCPGGIDNPCSNQGACVQDTATCSCQGGYAGPVCNITCMRTSQGVCNGVGKCFDGADGNGTCTCAANWVWPQTGCTSPCNCNGHGHCDFPTLKCICDNNYNGTSCERCNSGLFGAAACNMTCVAGQGVTSGYNCSCLTGFAGANCSIACPRSSSGVVCNNHGSCDLVTGFCKCENTWVGPACTCNDAQCKSVNVYTHCDDSLGSCICVTTRSGANCERCVVGYYGAPTNGVSCTTPCDCNSHGPCDMTTGVCSCFQDSTNGYWTGGTCSQCLAGYMGVKCDKLSNAITQTTDLVRRVASQQNCYYASLDSSARQLYIGGSGFQARFSVASIVAAPPETNTLFSSIYGELIYGSVIAVEKNITNSSQLIFVLQSNASEIIDPRIYDATVSPFFTEVANYTFNAIAQADNEIAGPLAFVFMRQDLRRICGMPSASIFFRVYCKNIAPNDPTANPAVNVQLDMKVQCTLSSPYLGMMIMGGTNPSSTICTFTGVTFYSKVVDLSLGVTAYLSANNLTCNSLTAMTEVNGVLFFSSLTPTAFIGAYNFSNHSYVTGIVVGGSSPCLAITYNANVNVGFAAYGSLIVKFEVVFSPNMLPAINTYGQIYTTSPYVSKFIQDDVLLLVYAPLSIAFGFQVLRFSLVEVKSFIPSYADRAGGALITVMGKGFRNSSTATCVFDKESIVPVFQYINDTAVVCVAPEKISSAVCLKQTLEVNMNGIVTTNGLYIQRPSMVIILDVTPRYVHVGEFGTFITITGRGFSGSPYAQCRFADPRDDHEYIAPANFSQANFSYACLAPNVTVPWSSESYVHISLDGFVYSKTTLPFLIIGQPNNIEVASYFQTTSSIKSYLTPALVVYSIDLNGNRLLTIDALHRNTTIRPSAAASASATWIQGNNSILSVDGTADFSWYYLVNPRFGDFVFQVQMDSWVANFTLNVVPGPVRSLIVKTQPQITSVDIIVPGSAMPRQVEVTALDAGGNDASAAAGFTAAVYLSLWFPDGRHMNDTITNKKKLTSVLFTTTGSANVGSLIVSPIFGIPYTLFFIFEQYPSINVSTNPFYAGCPATSYFVNGTADCAKCDAEHFTCNGTDIVVALENNWRSAASAPNFYSCPIEGACLVGGACSVGYEGPLCGVCQDGYGKDYTGKCGLCPSRPISIVIFVFLVLFQVLTFLFVNIVMIQNWSSPDALFVQCVTVLCIAFGHFQVASLLGNLDLSWTPLLRNTLAFLGMLFAFELDRVQAVNCLLNRNGINAIWFAIIYSLIVVCLIPILTFVTSKLLRWFPWLLLTKNARKLRNDLAQGAGAMAKVKLLKRELNKDGTPYVKEHQRKALLLNTSQVVITFCFQTSCRSALRLFQCTQIVYSDTDARNYLVADLSVSCDSSIYQSITGYSTFLVFVYVVGIPLLFIFGVAYSRKRHSESDFRLYTAFVTMGIKDMAFYWNGLLFFRRAFLVACDVFLGYPIQGWMGMWVVTLTAWLEHYASPWMIEKHNAMERSGFLVLVIMSNAALVFPQISGDTSRRAVEILIMTALCSLFAITLYISIYRLLRELQSKQKIKGMQEERIQNDEDTAVGLSDIIIGQAGQVKNLLKDMASEIKDRAKAAAKQAVDGGFSVMPTRADNESLSDMRRSGSVKDPSGDKQSSMQRGSVQRPMITKEEPPVFETYDDIERVSDESGGSDDDSDDARPRAKIESLSRPSRGSFRSQGNATTQQLDPSTLRRIELEKDIDDFIVNKGFGIYQQDPTVNSLYDSREEGRPISPTAPRRPKALEELMKKQGTVPKALQNIIGESSSDDSDDRSVDSDL